MKDKSSKSAGRNQKRKPILKGVQKSTSNKLHSLHYRLQSPKARAMELTAKDGGQLKSELPQRESERTDRFARLVLDVAHKYLPPENTTTAKKVSLDGPEVVAEAARNASKILSRLSKKPMHEQEILSAIKKEAFKSAQRLVREKNVFIEDSSLDGIVAHTTYILADYISQKNTGSEPRPQIDAFTAVAEERVGLFADYLNRLHGNPLEKVGLYPGKRSGVVPLDWYNDHYKPLADEKRIWGALVKAHDKSFYVALERELESGITGYFPTKQECVEFREKLKNQLFAPSSSVRG